MAVARLASVPASGLFTSCATPATSVPSDASREETASCARRDRSSVTSWETAIPMITVPVSSRTGLERISMVRPAISTSTRPSRPATASWWTPARRWARSGGKISA